MVLHELMFNALRHGVSNQGIIWINSRVEENHVIIDVIDDASSGNGKRDGAATAAAGVSAASVSMSGGLRPQQGTAVIEPPTIRAAGKTGLGLQLVRGLVARELQGQFTFASLADGRTLARVVFNAIRQTQES